MPPWTSHGPLNPRAGYNLSGQFCAETFGLLAPGLPDAAARIASHYVRVTVRGEPLQACVFTTATRSPGRRRQAPAATFRPRNLPSHGERESPEEQLWEAHSRR